VEIIEDVQLPNR